MLSRVSTSSAQRLGGRYELIAKVADGPIAAVWRGLSHGECGFTRPVAIRVLREPWDRERAILGAWAATASDLAQHGSPHVEQTLDLGTVDGRAYVVTEWIEGMSLRRWLADHQREGRRVPWPLATAIAVEVLRGLELAHAAHPPICHEGIEPRGVRLARSGVVKLTRFGVASVLAVRGAGRRKLEALGLRHPAPELVDGGSSSPASDVFAVGALLIEMLSGRSPYEAPGEARDAVVRRGALRDVPARRDDLPAELRLHLARATEVDPERRFESASEMVRALSEISRAEPEASWPEALAASVAEVIARPRPEVRPQGLVEQHTMHVDPAELTVLPCQAVVPDAGDDVEPPDEDDDDAPSRRYRFGYDERKASLAERASEPDPRPLTPKVAADPTPPPLPAKPAGLAPQKTELLDPDQVDRLTLGDAKPPALPPKGLAPQKTEFLDGDQVDRLTMPEGPKRS
jgi:serine/threonine protein kinase